MSTTETEARTNNGSPIIQMENLNKFSKRNDYQYILSLTFISKEKRNAKHAEESMATLFKTCVFVKALSGLPARAKGSF